jgi:YidC/Oxa1 family membrane protein insertase
VFSGLFDLIAGLLAWFYSLWPSYGMAIVLLTVLIMLLLSPLTISSTRQMIKMQRLQPELKKIQNEYRNDRQRMNEEVMRFYQENKVNPVGSCLPLLIQMPVFLILFRVLSGLTRRLTDVGYEVGAVAAQIAGGSDVAAVTVPVKQFDPDYLSTSTDLYQSLSQETEMVSWGIDLSKTAMDAFRDSVATGLPYLVMIILIGVLSWFQQKQIQGRNKNAVMNPQQQMLMKILPFMLPIFSFGFPAGLLVYFIVSSLVRVAQQAYITHVVYKKAQQDEQPLVVRSSTTGGKSGKADAVTAGSKQKSAGGGGASGTKAAANTRSNSAARRRRTTAGEQARQEQQRRSDAPADRSSKGGTAKNEPASPSRRVTPPGSSARPKKKRK